MKNAEELKREYNKLFGMMASSQNPKFMMLFGDVMTDGMDWFIKNKPELAEEMIERLESMKWKQYLTMQEARMIVDQMKPDAPWSYDTWATAMDSLGLEKEREGIFNSYALWTVMNAKYSDHARTLAEKVWAVPLAQVPAEKLVPVIHALALDSLLDEDGKFNVRTYFK